MLKFIYSKRGRAISDFDLDDFIKDIICDANKNKFYHCSTENLFNRVRLAIVEGHLNPENVLFVFNDEEITINSDGLCDKWSNGFLCESETTARNLLKARLVK